MSGKIFYKYIFHVIPRTWLKSFALMQTDRLIPEKVQLWYNSHAGKPP